MEVHTEQTLGCTNHLTNQGIQVVEVQLTNLSSMTQDLRVKSELDEV